MGLPPLKAAANGLFAQMRRTPAGQALLKRVEAGGVLSCHGPALGAQPFLAVFLHSVFPHRTILLVTEGTKLQENVFQDVQTWLAAYDQWNQDPCAPPASAPPGTRPACLFYPSWEILPHEDKLPHADVVSERLETLQALAAPAGAHSAAPIVVTSVSALLQQTFRAEHLRSSTRPVQRGDRIDPLALVEWLEDLGYEPEAQVNHKGEIALRGGILDIFPLSSPWPVRLEFFGDEIESIRFFDPATQMSREEIERALLPPGGELGLLKRRVRPGGSGPDPPEPALASLLEHLPPEAIVMLCEPEQLSLQAREYAQQIPAGDPFFISWDQAGEIIRNRGMTVVQVREANVSVSRSDRPPGPAAAGKRSAQARRARAASLDCPLDSLEAYRPLTDRVQAPQVADAQRREFFSQLHRWLRQGLQIHVFCNNQGEQQRFLEIWEEYGLGRVPPANDDPARPTAPADFSATMHTHLGTLTRGFLALPAQAVVVTDAEIFGRYKIMRPRRLKSPHAQAGRSLLDIDFSDWEEGDYVVHVQHGIGRYVGLTTVPLGGGLKPLEKAAAPSGATEECLVIEYAPTHPDQPPPRLYVPLNESHLVSKYVGAGKARPSLHSLGGGRWRKAKAQAEQAVRDLASELLSVQAAREALVGQAHAADTPWQREFESAFLYEETPDQLQAILETKRDLERPKPMDRLICGDVGYGKTEVAIRAAFKAVMSGKQTAVLVPTTVLAQQHFNTFTERTADYPIRVELLSRFRSARQQTKILADLAAGAVDIVIGTHRLIQKDVAFKDLGLVIIDEEQRFGVMHKEKFKLMRRLVDVLTLSATPIPRTLYLALTGARDMSTIETPPQDRLPVETIVCQYDERVIRDAIQRELNRQGQVFYLHNRVMDIESVALRLRALVPKARIVVGHGQMHADDLERVMTRFVNGQADVLLSTTIIESGLDIPNANTIIIEQADRFGLSDLYQLRGRVGRYKHQAYAYLVIPRHARMLTDARKRISAIKQYSTLGSGFKIALRDLEIRGAGNLLGPQQSGHITAVGFDLYCQLLKQSVQSLKGERPAPRVDVQIRLDFLALTPGAGPATTPAAPGPAQPPRSQCPPDQACAYLPAGYVSDARQRIQVYRKLAELSQVPELNQLQTELRDRFGPVPPAAALLLQVAELRLVAASKHITAVETKIDKLMLTRNADYITLGGRFPRLTRTQPAARLKEIVRLLQAL